MDILVIGGGALGCSAALALAERNHDVTLRERQHLGAGSTSKAAGIVSTMTWCDDDYQLVAETRGRIGELMSLGIAEGVGEAARRLWRSHDSLVIARGQNIATLDDMQDRLERHTEEPERMDWQTARATYPTLRFSPGEEILIAQEDGVVEAGDLMDVLRSRLQNEAVTLQENTSADPIPADLWGHDAVVVAGGAWTRTLLDQSGIRTPLQSYRTQAASIAFPEEVTPPIVHDLTRQFYARPESDKSILAGNGTQLRPFESDNYNEIGDPEFIQSIAERTMARFRGADHATVRASWAGLCVATPDRRPLCGAIPEAWGNANPKQLYVLTGDNGFGLMRCLALGERLADAVAGHPTTGLQPERFGNNPTNDFDMQEGYGYSANPSSMNNSQPPQF